MHLLCFAAISLICLLEIKDACIFLHYIYYFTAQHGRLEEKVEVRSFGSLLQQGFEIREFPSVYPKALNVSGA